MHFHILEVLRQPSPVDQDATGLSVLVQVSVEGGDDLLSYFSVVVLINEDLFCVIEDALDSDLLHGPIVLKSV